MIYNESKYNRHWETKRLSDLGTFSRGISKHRPRNDKCLFEGGGYPLIQTGEIKSANLYITNHTQEYGEFGLRQSKLWDTGTLCITIAANIAETAILSYPMCFPDSVVGFKANRKQSSELFMYYVFDFVRHTIQNAATGSAQDNINIDYLTSLDFKVPTKENQDRIVRVLSAIDGKILKNTQINDNLEQQLYLLYDYWFTQFDFPDANGKPYRSSGGQMVWNNELKRNIPENWYVVPLGEVSSFRNGINYDKNTSGDTTYHIVNVRNISSSSILLDERGLDEICLPCEQAKKYIVSSESILIARSGIPGAPRILYDPSEDIIFCGFIICATPTDSILQHYLTLFLKQLEGSTATQTGGSILKNVSQDTLRNLLVPIPSKDVLTQFNRRVALIYQFMHNHQKETSKLQDLRNWLLPMLMNGQATVIE